MLLILLDGFSYLGLISLCSKMGLVLCTIIQSGSLIEGYSIHTFGVSILFFICSFAHAGRLEQTRTISAQ